MTPQTLGLIIGGILPAFFFGYSNVAVKMSTNAGLGLPYVLLMSGAGGVVVGGVLLFMNPESAVNTKSALIMFSGGLIWAISMACITYAITKFNMPLSQLNPLFNLNTLVAVLASLWLFAEWQQVKVPQLLMGSLLIVAGGALVARA